VIYHVLTEQAPFSDVSGGAISRWVANMADSSDHAVVCLSFDSSWKFRKGRRITLRRLRFYRVLCRFHMVRAASIFSRNLSLWLFATLVRQLNKGDVVWIHNRPEHAAALAPTLHKLGVAVVLHMHNPLPSGLNRTQIDALKRIPLIFCSRFLKDKAGAQYSGALQRTFHLYNGADAKLFHPPVAAEVHKEKVPTVLFVGRLMPYKGAHILLKAMKILRKGGVNAFCRIIGASFFGGSKPNEYIRSLEKSCPTNTSLNGHRSGVDLAEEFRQADIFCCPSVWEEPFGMVIVEAMASGVPVIASDAGGIPEALQFGGGILVPPNDAEALAAALLSLIANSKLRIELGKQGLAAIREHFSWARIQLRYRDILKEITA
jgi:spore coat protein SA